jgi:hypothetical protein
MKNKEAEKTKVIFLLERGSDNEVFAYFPYLNYNEDRYLKTCYAHIGQHSACHSGYAKNRRKATKEQYLPIQKELESIGYNLEVLNK